MNRDGIKDFKFSQFASYGFVSLLSIKPVNSSNQIMGSGGQAAALKAGSSIGPSGQFGQNNLMASDICYSSSGDFRGSWVTSGGKGLQSRYLGLKFIVNGQTHYGWARLNVTLGPPCNISGRLTGYAYETTPNKPIVAGKTKGPDVVTVQPASLGNLARGASSIPTWRVKVSAPNR